MIKHKNSCTVTGDAARRLNNLAENWGVNASTALRRVLREWTEVWPNDDGGDESYSPLDRHGSRP